MRHSQYLVYAIKDIASQKYIYVGKSSTGLCRPYSHLYGKSGNAAINEFPAEKGLEVDILDELE